MMIFFWLLIIFGIYYIVRNDKVKTNSSAMAEDLLKTRYIKGEIDEATFEQMKKTINN
jgi:uncharacterized membrane protein